MQTDPFKISHRLFQIDSIFFLSSPHHLHYVDMKSFLFPEVRLNFPCTIRSSLPTTLSYSKSFSHHTTGNQVFLQLSQSYNSSFLYMLILLFREYCLHTLHLQNLFSLLVCHHTNWRNDMNKFNKYL